MPYQTNYLEEKLKNDEFIVKLTIKDKNYSCGLG
jgi:hypothetical protein